EPGASERVRDRVRRRRRWERGVGGERHWLVARERAVTASEPRDRCDVKRWHEEGGASRCGETRDDTCQQSPRAARRIPGWLLDARAVVVAAIERERTDHTELRRHLAETRNASVIPAAAENVARVPGAAVVEQAAERERRLGSLDHAVGVVRGR